MLRRLIPGLIRNVRFWKSDVLSQKSRNFSNVEEDLEDDFDFFDEEGRFFLFLIHSKSKIAFLTNRIC